MFKDISINLTGPICRCHEQKLRFAITRRRNAIIFCPTCGMRIDVPADQFYGQFILDTPYPANVKPKPRPKPKAKPNNDFPEFKRITIELSNPLCDCGVEHLAFRTNSPDATESRLTVFCKKCGVEKGVSNGNFIAAFSADRSTPLKPEPEGYQGEEAAFFALLDLQMKPGDDSPPAE